MPEFCYYSLNKTLNYRIYNFAFTLSSGLDSSSANNSTELATLEIFACGNGANISADNASLLLASGKEPRRFLSSWPVTPSTDKSTVEEDIMTMFGSKDGRGHGDKHKWIPNAEIMHNNMTNLGR